MPTVHVSTDNFTPADAVPASMHVILSTCDPSAIIGYCQAYGVSKSVARQWLSDAMTTGRAVLTIDHDRHLLRFTDSFFLYV